MSYMFVFSLVCAMQRACSVIYACQCHEYASWPYYRQLI